MRAIGFNILFIAAAIAAVSSLAFFAYQTSAAEDRYQFTIRGTVTGIDHANKNITVVASHFAAATAINTAKTDLGGIPVVYKVPSNAVFYKWINGKKQKVTFSKAIGAGDTGKEVVIRGAAKSGGNYNIAWLVVNDRSFSVIGKLRENNTATNTLKVLVGTSSYKQSSFVNKEVVMNYDNATKFKSLGKDVDNDDVPGSDQKVKVEGDIVDSVWKVTRVYDNVK